MSKKLLMNNRGDNGLSPTQNGLVCWLDAFDLTDKQQSLTWADRTNNNNDGTFNFSLNSVNMTVNNGVLIAENSVQIPNPTKGLSQYTVEIGYEDISAKYWLGLWGNTSESSSTYYKGVSIYQEKKLIGGYPFTFYSTPKDVIEGGKNYVTTTLNSNQLTVYHNGVKLYTINTTNQTPPKEMLPSEANYFCFMARKPNNATIESDTGADMISSKWYFIRIYNRVLTPEEVLANYNYELSLQRGE